MAFETVIEHVTANVRERLAAAAVDERVYAVALMTADTEDVSVRHIAIGLERDRAAATRERETVGVDAWTALGGDPRDYVLNRVAANVGADPPLEFVTDDFVVYAFTDDLADELVANVTFSATPAAARLLRARHLLAG